MDDSSRKKLAIHASRDLFFSVLALMVYNGVLQLFIYPGLNDGMGAEAFGTVLYLLSVISIMGAGFGTAASYSRMVAKKERTEKNGDYNLFILIVSGISLILCFFSLLALKELSAALYIQVLLLMTVTVIRYYSDVEYRMNIRFVDYFFFFIAVSAGYVVGLILYPYTHNWVLTIFLGEISGIIYTVVRGHIFRRPFTALSQAYKENLKSAFVISASNLLSALVLNSDRILLRLVVGAREVTVFYTASLIGKIVALLTTPLNGVIISYFTGYDLKLKKRLFSLICFMSVVGSLILALICTFVSKLFVKIMYPDVFEEAGKFFYMANLGQILYFVSGTLMVIVLSFTSEKFQLYINIFYGCVFMAIIIPMTCLFGLEGLAIGLVVVNVLRLLATAVCGLRHL